MAGDAPAVSSSIPKPKLRGLHNASIIRNLSVALGLCAIITTAVKFIHNDSVKKDYAEFYKTYDAMKSFNRMKDAGLLQSTK